MDGSLTTLLGRLHEDGLRYDAAEPDRRLRRRNLEPEAARFLWVILQALCARTVVEIGTSNGYSTIWLADALRVTGGRLVSVDVDADVQREASANLAEAGLETYVELRTDDGGRFLAVAASETVDVLFLDSERPEYPDWWPHPIRVLRPGGLLVMDNVLSHPDEVASSLSLVEADGRLASTIVPVGKGQLLAVKLDR